jgi:hypothetical protein
MRVYALYDRNRWVLASLCLVAAAVVGHGCVCLTLFYNLFPEAI